MLICFGSIVERTSHILQRLVDRKCRNCHQAFASIAVEKEEKSNVNLNIIPLAALLTFVLVCCCKCCRWAREDIREWDDTHLEVICGKNSFYVSRDSIPCVHTAKSCPTTKKSLETTNHSSLQSTKVMVNPKVVTARTFCLRAWYTKFSSCPA